MALVTISGTIPDSPGDADLWPWLITADGVESTVHPNNGQLTFQVEAGSFLLRNPIDGVTRSCTASQNSDLWTVFNAGQRLLTQEEEQLVARLEAVGVVPGGGGGAPSAPSKFSYIGDASAFTIQDNAAIYRMVANEEVQASLAGFEYFAAVFVLPQDPEPGTRATITVQALEPGVGVVVATGYPFNVEVTLIGPPGFGDPLANSLVGEYGSIEFIWAEFENGLGYWRLGAWRHSAVATLPVAYANAGVGDILVKDTAGWTTLTLAGLKSALDALP